MFVCFGLKAQTLNFVLSVDTIAIGDTLTVNNTSSYRIANDKQKETNKNSLDFYPNPAKDFVFIRCKGLISVEISTMAGIVLKKQTFNYQGEAIVSISLLNYAQGVYIIKATSETEEKIAKLIIIR